MILSEQVDVGSNSPGISQGEPANAGNSHTSSETVKETKKEKIRKMLHAGYSTKEIVTALGVASAYVSLVRGETVINKEQGLSIEHTPNDHSSTSIRKEKFLKQFRKHHSLVIASCKAAQIHSQTYYIWLRSDPEFAQAIDDIREEVIDDVESKLMQRINAQDMDAIKTFLKAKAKNRGYSDRVEHTGANGNPITVRVIEPFVDPLTEEQVVEAEYEMIEPTGDTGE